MNTGNEPITSKNGLLTTLAASVSDEVEYALEMEAYLWQVRRPVAAG